MKAKFSWRRWWWWWWESSRKYIKTFIKNIFQHFFFVSICLILVISQKKKISELKHEQCLLPMHIQWTDESKKSHTELFRVDSKICVWKRNDYFAIIKRCGRNAMSETNTELKLESNISMWNGCLLDVVDVVRWFRSTKMTHPLENGDWFSSMERLVTADALVAAGCVLVAACPTTFWAALFRRPILSVCRCPNVTNFIFRFSQT